MKAYDCAFVPLCLGKSINVQVLYFRAKSLEHVNYCIPVRQVRGIVEPQRFGQIIKEKPLVLLHLLYGISIGCGDCAVVSREISVPVCDLAVSV